MKESHEPMAPFHVEVRHGEAVNLARLHALFASVEFRCFANLLPDGIVVVDPDEMIGFINTAASEMAAPARELEGRPFDRFLRHSALDLDEFIASAARGRSRGIVRERGGNRTYTAMKRTLMVVGEPRGFAIYLFRGGAGLDGGKTDVRAARTARVPSPVEQESLVLPPELERQIVFANRAYARGARILLLGESGVGKTAIAKHIHASAGNSARPLVHVNCGGIPETLFESELFGYERGSFTGALAAGKRGYIESAAEGTLFLDEIGEIPLASQANLLKFLEDGTIQPIGSPISKSIDTRVIAATNRDLRAMVQAGEFRRDLYFRIATFPVHIPPLRERSDKEALLDVLLARVNRQRPVALKLSAECRATLLKQSYPGNLRELRSYIEYLDIVAEDVARPEHLPVAAAVTATHGSGDAGESETIPFAGASLKELTRAFEDEVIKQHIGRYGSKREAARQLGVDIATLVRKTTRD